VALAKGAPGETYNIGGNAERRNIDVVHAICDTLQQLRPRGGGYRALVKSVPDRPGHDRRYAMDIAKIRAALGWSPRHTFEAGLADTVSWYLANAAWVAQVKSGEYRQWIEKNYAARSAQ
jgi:dTDP-glucose 4,6-dehydratase